MRLLLQLTLVTRRNRGRRRGNRADILRGTIAILSRRYLASIRGDRRQGFVRRRRADSRRLDARRDMVCCNGRTRLGSILSAWESGIVLVDRGKHSQAMEGGENGLDGAGAG